MVKCRMVMGWVGSGGGAGPGNTSHRESSVHRVSWRRYWQGGGGKGNLRALASICSDSQGEAKKG